MVAFPSSFAVGSVSFQPPSVGLPVVGVAGGGGDEGGAVEQLVIEHTATTHAAARHVRTPADRNRETTTSMVTHASEPLGAATWHGDRRGDSCSVVRPDDRGGRAHVRDDRHGVPLVPPDAGAALATTVPVAVFVLVVWLPHLDHERVRRVSAAFPAAAVLILATSLTPVPIHLTALVMAVLTGLLVAARRPRVPAAG